MFWIKSHHTTSFSWWYCRHVPMGSILASSKGGHVWKAQAVHHCQSWPTTSINGLIMWASPPTPSPSPAPPYLSSSHTSILLPLSNRTYTSVSEHLSILFPLFLLDIYIAWPWFHLGPRSNVTLLHLHAPTSSSSLTMFSFLYSTHGMLYISFIFIYRFSSFIRMYAPPELGLPFCL